MDKSKLLLSLGLVMSSSFVLPKEKESGPDKPNILFIAVDDLRPELGCYGHSHIKTPNIDRLAMSGIIFKNAYASSPSCGPSRASLLSGIYTSNTRFSGWNCSQDKDVPGMVSLPMHFRNHNYTTVSLGKVYNNFGDGRGSWDFEWRPPATTTEMWDWQSAEGIRIFEELNRDRHKDMRIRDYNNLPGRGLPYERPDVPDITYMDGRIANRAIEELQDFRNSGEPFFLVAGFYKPHLPFNAPAKYWDMYDRDEIKLPSNYYFPKDAPDAARFNWGELRAYHGIPKEGPVDDTAAISLIHGYYASVSYIDAQVGLIINALESLGMAENTIIVFWGDHGFFLGEHGFWSKYNNFRRAAHIPLIVKVPWKSPGLKSSGLIETVDIFPTLCDLAGISKPFHLHGKSFAGLIDNRGMAWKEEIFFRATGETIITNTHAYTEYLDYKTGKPYARMLYDHRVDPEENVNVSERPENEKLVMELHEKLHNHIRERDKLAIP